MEWRFGEYVLNRSRADLTGPEGSVRVEKLPLELLFLLAENYGRVVTREEIVKAVWGGRAVSESVISTAVKQARKAVGDTGASQSIIKTIHGRGFRFVAPLLPPACVSAADAPGTAEPAAIGSEMPSLAVLRFQLHGEAFSRHELGDGIPAELIASLSRVGWLHIIARASSFRFDPDSHNPEEIGRQLGVRYLLTGQIIFLGERLTITVELASAGDGALVWSERYTVPLHEVQMMRRDIVASIVGALEIHVPKFESEHARRLSPGQLDAWSHYHLGLRHMYRYNEADNLIASSHFRSAIELDGEFARAHAGLSFTSWQSAFMQYGDDRRQWINLAVGQAARALEIDGHDPFANFSMGRARWLEGDVEGGIDWLDRALTINPNYAQCHYTRSLSRLLAGAPLDAQQGADRAMRLSPLDPLLYAMLCTKGLSFMATGQFDEARRFAEQAVHVPGAHFYIFIVAAVAHELAGDRNAAEAWCEKGLACRPDLTAPMFFQAFPFKQPAMRSLFGEALSRLYIR